MRDDTLALGAALRRSRLAAGLTQEVLAERAGLSVDAVGAIERGLRRPRASTVRALCAALGLTAIQTGALEAAVQARRRMRVPVLPPGLPVAANPLVGRTHDVAVLVYLLETAAVRLLTLTGPGGIGKTRLAVQAAIETARAFPDGVIWIDLSPLCAADLVEVALARRLGVPERANTSLRESLRASLQDRSLLLVLDNFEQVWDARNLLAELLAACSRLHLLVTSRAALRVSGEQEYVVAPLGLPEPTAPLAELAQAPAVVLFMQRTRAILPAAQLTATTAPLVAAICRRLDGLPLAIELAAALARTLPPQELLARLDDAPSRAENAATQPPASRLDVLAGGAWDLPDRQQTVRQTIAWSYDLLTPDEQALFRCLGVFAGGGTVTAVGAVGGALGASADSVLAGLRGLRDKSLVLLDDSAPEPRVDMLETIRAFARERLAASNDEAPVRHAHARVYITLAEHAEPALIGVEQEWWLDRLEREHDNLRAILAWASAHAVTIGLRLAGLLWRFWYTRGYTREGRSWIECLTSRHTVGDTVEATHWRTRALAGAASLAYRQGDYAGATALAEASVTLSRQGDADLASVQGLRVLALVARDQGNQSRAIQMHEEILARCRALADQHGTSITLHNLGLLWRDQGDYGRARAYYEESLTIKRATGDITGLAWTLNNLGDVAWAMGDVTQAEVLCAEGLDLARRVGDKGCMAYALNGLGTAALTRKDYVRARQCYGESLALRHSIGDEVGVAGALINLGTVASRQGETALAATHYHASLLLGKSAGLDLAECLQGLAEVCWQRSDPERAAMLLGVTAALYDTLNGVVPPPEIRANFERVGGLVRDQLGIAAFQQGWEAGRSQPMAQVLIDLARSEPGTRDSGTAPGTERR